MGDKSAARKLGYLNRSADALGIPRAVYLTEVGAGRKWCFRCRAWHPRSDFGSDRTQGDGRNQRCLRSKRVAVRRSSRSRGSTGLKASAETRHKMRLAHSGERSSSWKGGITKATKRARQNALYQAWRRAVLERDDRACQRCDSKPEHPHVHHVKSFREHPELRLDVSNGLTLCPSCHREEHTRG